MVMCEVTDRRRDQIRGCLIGGAVGDALGYAVEFRSYDEITLRYGCEGITDYELDHGKALISDDTQMTLFTAEGILRGETEKYCGQSRKPTEDYVYKSYLDWLSAQTGSGGKDRPGWLLNIPELHDRRAPGITCLKALLSGKQGSIEKPLNNSKGCGGVMRIAPVGLYYEKPMDRLAAQAAAITHGHSLGYMPAAVIAHMINRLVYGEPGTDLYDVVEDAKQAVSELFADDEYIDVLTELIDLAVKLSRNDHSDVKNIRRLGEGWVGEEAMAIAIYCSLRYQNDFSRGIIAAVNHSGDSDSTGAIAGNILGAKLGDRAIHKTWKEMLELNDVIYEIADDLCDGAKIAVGGGEYDRVWRAKYARG